MYRSSVSSLVGLVSCNSVGSWESQWVARVSGHQTCCALLPMYRSVMGTCIAQRPLCLFLGKALAPLTVQLWGGQGIATQSLSQEGPQAAPRLFITGIPSPILSFVGSTTNFTAVSLMEGAISCAVSFSDLQSNALCS